MTDKTVIKLTAPAKEAYEAVLDGCYTSIMLAERLDIKQPAATGRMLHLFKRGAIRRINEATRGPRDAIEHRANDVEIVFHDIYGDRGKKISNTDRSYEELDGKSPKTAFDDFIYKRNYK